jgi:hypothetical protein
MKLRRLTDAGIESFRGYLATLAADPAAAVPTGLLTDPAASEPLPTSAEVVPQTFGTRFAAGQYLHALLGSAGIPGLDRDRGVWTWLTLFYFDELCPADGHGKRKAGEEARSIPNMAESRRFYRHLLLGPYVLVRMYHNKPELLRVFLMNEMTVGTSETYRSFIENVELLASVSAVTVANQLYYDPAKQKLRRGAGAKVSGSVRRLTEYLNQLTLTCDLQATTPVALMKALPKEFATFVNAYRNQTGSLLTA